MTRIEQYRRGRLVFDVDDAGPVDGEAVVLLHGFPANRTGWRPVADRLGAAGYRTLAPDQRGYSPGARPPGRRNYRRDWLVDDVLALVDEIGAPVHLVGHDWGGLIAWRTAQRAPDRLRTLTVLSTPHPAVFSDAFRESDQLRRSWYMAMFQVPWLPERVLAGPRLAVVLERMGLPSHLADQYAAHLREPAALRAALDWYRALPLPDPADVPVVPTAVTVPTTFMWGSRDEALGRFGAERTEAYVAAPYRFIEVPENHWLPETVPDLVADAVLEGIDGARA
jgi:pimeloyl-ACP methyl ester carboxylesterase